LYYNVKDKNNCKNKHFFMREFKYFDDELQRKWGKNLRTMASASSERSFSNRGSGAVENGAREA